MRPDIGIQAQFKKKKEPAKYRYDRSLDPQLSWDINADREHAEALIEKIVGQASSLPSLVAKGETTKAAAEAAALQSTAEELKSLSSPFLNWAGKAERDLLSVPTLPLFTHERLSTEAILKSVQTHKQQLDLFADAKLDLAERVLRAYEHKSPWVNRLILGDSLVVMNSLLKYEALGGQVQCIYVDPPYGVKFGSNFQPFIRKRDVRHNDDADLTREPEMVQAYRDTWELGLHSYLTYLRDRFLLCRELLAPSGSIFVQISDENLHHVREVMDEVFGAENFCGIIAFKKTSGQSSTLLASIFDYVIWYGKDKQRTKSRMLFEKKEPREQLGIFYDHVDLPGGTRRKLTREEIETLAVPSGAKVFQGSVLYSEGTTMHGGYPITLGGKEYFPPANAHWKTNAEGMARLMAQRRVFLKGNTLRYSSLLRRFSVLPDDECLDRHVFWRVRRRSSQNLRCSNLHESY